VTLDPSASPSDTSAGLPASPGVKRRWLLVVLAMTFLFILMPFLFWQATWFGRPLTDAQLERSLADAQQPREVQHGLSQIADRILAADPRMHASARQFYPDVVKIAGSSDDDLRLTAAWVMGQDNTVPEFHQELLLLLRDGNPMVRRNAALALIRFADASGHDEIMAIFQPYTVVAPQSGNLAVRLKPGDAVNPGTLLGHIGHKSQNIEVRSQVPGTVDRWLVGDGAAVAANQPILLVDASSEEIWEALRALYLIGLPQDLQTIGEWARAGANITDNIRKQAESTTLAIRFRGSAGIPTLSTAPSAAK
jgi:biotin carboxyl carrier protein